MEYLRSSVEGGRHQVVKSSPIAGPEGPRVFHEVKVPRWPDNGTGWW